MHRSLLALIAAATLPALAQDGGALGGHGLSTRASGYSVAETMDRIESAVKGIGSNVFSRIDFQQVAQGAKVDIRPSQLLIYGRGRATVFIKEAPLAGLDLPFKVLAWEDAQGKVWVSYTTGSYIDQRYSVKNAGSLAKDLDAAIEKVVTDALK